MKKTKLKTYDNSWYKEGNHSRNFLWFAVNICFFKCPFPFPNSIKSWILKLFGGQIGKNVIIKPNVSIKYPWLLKVKDDVWIGEHVWIDNLAMVSIDSNVCISQGAMLLCGNHDYKKSTFDLIVKPINLEEGVWIGAKSIVCPGVTCKSHSILSVGSIATQDLEAYTIYQGNPAIKIREREILK